MGERRPENPATKRRGESRMLKYAYSIKTSRIAEKDFPYNAGPLDSPDVVVTFARSLQDADIEKLIVLYLNGLNSLICIQVVPGTANGCNVYPREIFRHALLAGACAIVLVHNHPSGGTVPSLADIKFTNTIKATGELLNIPLHDHIIIGQHSAYWSFKQHHMC
jgi:DNA repair protein RadC